MDTPEKDVEPEVTGFENGPKGEDASSNPAQSVRTNHSYREHITDRTGDVIREAVAVAREFPQVRTGMVAHPIDGTQAHVSIGADGVHAVDPSIFDRYRQMPMARTGQAILTRLSSFIELIERHKLPGFTSVFVDEALAHQTAAGSMTAVFDYHSELQKTGHGEMVAHIPQYGRHTARYAFPLSEEWRAWMGNNKVPMGIKEFAAFIEDRIVDIRHPDEIADLSEAAGEFVTAIGGKVGSPTAFMEMSRGIQVSESSEVVNAHTIASGEVQFGMATKHESTKTMDGQQFEIPSLFLIAIPVFANATVLDRMVVRFRYRKVEGNVVFFYELWRPDLVLQQSINDAVEQVQDTTSVPVFFGKPETAG